MPRPSKKLVTRPQDRASIQLFSIPKASDIESNIRLLRMGQRGMRQQRPRRQSPPGLREHLRPNRLDTIDLRDNHLTRSLSRLDFGSLTNLSYLALEQNSINGSIPRSLFLLPSLSLLMLANNRFSGEIEEFPIVNDLELLDLSNNMIKGPLPSSFFHFPNIFSIQLSNNLSMALFICERS
ncbi:receptor-like protein 9DC1 [Salvia hispanica]|uniref:receptor-like protein 9DC1 n=1 Tax=Salvia hispanica TaxID=49212 RepID=UPI002009D459|nr:receptor-like protein 9DC1 [Salvia hispanica]